ncbi:hypothetical protein D9756_000921 [Leucocoprinus leucothites]|uniref:Uncharacterized protein n=1 Tax=Leucocoprinus leucothites TaxID=201217 RepID=A0A8H5GFS8_9AGAR|nr:hypothetical protein D9756_000921 [Leucoagaricus leucothites]
MSEVLPSKFTTGEIREVTVYTDLNWSLGIRQLALFGYCFDILLYGFLTVQVYLYHLAFPKDKRLTKIAVYLVYTIGSIQTAFALRDFHELFCIPGALAYVEPNLLSDDTDDSDLHTFGFMWLTIPVSSALVAVTVQLFYAQRIWIISHSKIITLTVAFLALAQLGCGIFSAIVAYGILPPSPGVLITVKTRSGIGTIVNMLVSASYNNIAILEVTIIRKVWSLVGALCDLVIAVFMFVYPDFETDKRNIEDNAKVSTQNQATFIRDWAIDRGIKAPFKPLPIPAESGKSDA